MAKERMVTRTFTIARCEVMCCNTETAEVTISSYDFPIYTEKQKDKLLDCLKAEYETYNQKLVALQSVEYSDKLIGIREADFVRWGTELPSRTV